MQTRKTRKSAGLASLGPKKVAAQPLHSRGRRRSAAEGSAGALTPHTFKGELRLDSRLLAQYIGIKPKRVMAVVDRDADQLKQHGVLPFQKTKPGPRGGRPERYALLNEAQAIHIVVFAKNSAQVAPLKAAVVAAFIRVRDNASVRSTQYLPLYHDMHEAVTALIRRARECGSTTPDARFHSNANRLLNSVTGIPNGERDNLTVKQRLVLTTLQCVFSSAVHDSLAEGDDHRTATQKARSACEEYMARAGCHLLSPARMAPSIRHATHAEG